MGFWLATRFYQGLAIDSFTDSHHGIVLEYPDAACYRSLETVGFMCIL